MWAMSKRFGPLRFRNSIREKQAYWIFRFGYGKALNDKKVPDRVGSGVFVLQKVFGQPRCSKFHPRQVLTASGTHRSDDNAAKATY